MVLATESVPDITGSVPGPPEGSGGPPGGATSPEGLHAPIVGRDQPLGGLGRLPTKAHAPREKRGQTLRGRWALRPMPGAPPSPPTWPPPQMGIGAAATPRVETLGGGAALPLPLYIVEAKGQPNTRSSSSSWRSPIPLPPPLPRCLAKPCGIATLLHHHHAVVLLLDGVFPNLSLSPCWIKAWETSPGCTCVERGGAVRSALGHR